MPLYEFLCPKCKLEFEIIKSFTKMDEEELCPTCSIPSERKKFSKNVVHDYKGTGFYTTDYKRSGD